MKILRSPLDFNEQDISELQTRAVGESPFLEYKRDLDLSHDGKVELLKDVSAMANADGGVTIYGVAQDESGAPSGLPGLTIQEPDKLQVQIAQVLMDGLDPPIPGVVHRAIPRTDGTWFYVIRVPASHLAPHMITIKTTKPRFYMRVNTVNVPMSATQIKEVALRQEHAERSALAFVRQRLEWNTRFPGPWYMLNIIPLFQEPYALELADQEIVHHLVELGLTAGDPYHSVHGFFVAYESRSRREHTLFSRNGAVECFKTLIVDRLREGGPQCLDGTYFERQLLEKMETLARAQVRGLVQPPALLRLQLHQVRGTAMLGLDGFPTGKVCEEAQIVPDPLVVYNWTTDLNRAMKRFFDVLWQAYGMRGSPHYDKAGNRTDR
jgi:hypothetical protein